MWQDLKRCEGPMHGIVKLFTDDHEIIISIRELGSIHNLQVEVKRSH